MIKKKFGFEPKKNIGLVVCLKKGKKKFPIKLTKHNNKKIEINNEEEANKIINDLSQNDYRVEKLKRK